MSNYLIEYFDNIKSIEDLVLISYACIFEEFEATKVRKYYSIKNRDKHIKEIEKYIYEYYEEEITIGYKAFQKLMDNLKLAVKKYTFGFNEYYCIIKTIDTNYEYKSRNFTLSFSSIRSFKSLSTISCDPDIFILPRMARTYNDIFNDNLISYERKNKYNKNKAGLRPRYEYDENSINSKLQNFIIIHKKEISNNSLIVHELIANSKSVNDFKNKIIQNGKIKICIVPLSNFNINNMFSIGEDESSFWIEEMNPSFESDITQRYIDAIDRYKRCNIDFLVFPEMLLSDKILTNIKEYLKNNETVNQQIYILGSMWSKDDFSNKTVVMLSNGEIIFEQYKKTAFKLNGKDEKILYYDKKIHILDIHGVARMNVFICKDVTDGALMSLPMIIDSNLIIAPSFSPSLNMDCNIQALASGYHCTTVLANSCSCLFDEYAIENNKEIGFICQPAKNNTKSYFSIVHYKFDKKCEECKNFCTGYIVELNFSKIDKKGEIMTFETIINR